MSLRQKFFVILVLLALTLGSNVALSIWSIRFLERELAWPLRSAQPVLAGLHNIKRAGEQQASDLGIGRFMINEVVDAQFVIPDSQVIVPKLIGSEEQILGFLNQMEDVDSLRLRSGVSTTQNLRTRSDQILRKIDQWSRESDLESYETLIELVEARHELIERIEGRIIEDAALANTYGQRLRFLIYSIIAIGLVGAALVAAYSVLLLRRWVLDPVRTLRIGAQHFSQGEFDHAIDIPTGDELGQLSDEFNHMASTIQTMQDERVERERLAAMGEMAQRTVHNLRTPLAGIRALAETTQSELPHESDLYEIQGRIISSVDRFEGWLQGMLRVSSPLELHHRGYMPTDLVSNMIESHRGAAESRSVALRLSIEQEPGESIGDPDQLEHAITAVLSNAIDYAPSGSTIDILLDTSFGKWTVAIRDRGPGIPRDIQESIFRPYYTTRKGGTGIGLALVKRIIDQHRGTIEVQSPVISDSGSGTRFIIEILTDSRTDRKM
jgi:signal transduction histidine kinase